MAVQFFFVLKVGVADRNCGCVTFHACALSLLETLYECPVDYLGFMVRRVAFCHGC